MSGMGMTPGLEETSPEVGGWNRVARTLCRPLVLGVLRVEELDLRKEFVHGKPSWERVAVAEVVAKLSPVVVRLLVLYEIYILCIYIVVRRCGSVPRAGAPEATEPPPE